MNSQTSRNISTIVGAINIVPSFMLTRKLVQSAGWKGSMLPGPNIAVMRQNKALSAVYLGLMAVQVGFAVKALVDQYKEDSVEETETSKDDEVITFAFGDDVPDEVKEALGQKLHLLISELNDTDVASILQAWPDDEELRCEVDHVNGGPCLTPLSEDGTCPNEADHDMPARV